MGVLIVNAEDASIEHVPRGVFRGVLSQEDARAGCGGPAVHGPLGSLKTSQPPSGGKNLGGQRRKFARRKRIGDSILPASLRFSVSFPTFSLL